MKHAVLTLALLGMTAFGLNSLVGAQTTRTSASSTAAAPEAVNIVLHDGDTQYVVPTGKVLTIENFIWALESDSTHQTLLIRPANYPAGIGSFLLKFSSTAPDMFTPERPIRIVGDGFAGVTVLNNGAADWRDVLITGTLRDA